MAARLARHQRDYGATDPRRRLIGWAVVLAIHALALWALVSGTARQTLDALRKPMQAVVIQEVVIPPPPPPPPPPPQPIRPPEAQAPRVSTPPPLPPPPFVPPPEVAVPAVAAPAIAAATTPPPAPPMIAPPSPPVAAPVPPPAPVAAPPAPRAVAIGVLCPTQVAPVMPRAAIRRGIEGMVKAEAVIRDGVVREVNIVSGPRELHEAVRDAMRQYRCVSGGTEVRATQEFNFRLE